MLAIKLHEKRHPYLGVGSHLMPFLTTAQGRCVLGSWARMLIKGRWISKDCNISLVKIGDNVPVYLSPDWGITKFVGLHPKADDFKVLLAKEAKPLSCWDKSFLLEIQHSPIFPDESMTFSADYPELILAEKVASSAVKWTKRYQLWRRHE